MTGKNVVLIVIAVLALGAAGYMVVNQSGDHGPELESMDSEMFFTCKNADCQEEFSMTKREYVNTRGPEGQPPCPECGLHTTKMAIQCPECKRNVELVGHAALPPNCPHCNHSFGNYRKQFKKEQEFHDQVSNGKIGPG